MSPPKQALIDDVVAALDARQLKKFMQQTKMAFANQIAKKLPRRRQIIKDSSVADEHAASLTEAATQALTGLKNYEKIRYKPAATSNMAVIHGLLADKEVEQLTLKAVIASLERISTAFDHSKKTGQNNTEACLIANMVAKIYTETFGITPTHNHSFQTYAYSEADWAKSEKGNPTPFDKVCLVIHKHTGVSFSEATLRKAVSRRYSLEG